ncbi:hypothetical protein B0H65DRAFT_88775 [Neurospora tetraspora]|uniref:CFEM domain-containing protein n=1 Tax=Neurospora tetraspora TaxID=94610 RepID=A0AAE0JJF6_9PEZI|nr:hypothetical protein B0H65DRAFT_88775 [Neurospora tetraspora]
MKYSAVALAAFVAVASAQDISIIPSCALPCIDKAAESVCTSKTDYKCICEKKDSLVSSATGCVIGACGADVALNKVLPATETFCKEVLSGAGSSAAPSSSAAATTAAPASSSAAAAPSSSAAATTSAPAVVSSSAAAATTLAPSSSVSAAPAPSSNGTVSMAPPASSSPAEAGAAVAGYIGSFGVAALAALAAF